MQRNLRPWVTTGVVLVGASLIAVTPVATPLPDAQHRAFRLLVDYDEFDLSQLTTTTEANWSGLETALSSSNWLTDPDISQGFSTLFTDLSTGTSNPVTNPIALLTEGALLLTSSGDASNAASTALTAVTDNVESALSSGDYSTALTDLENGPTTVLDAYLNGYPETVGSGLISPEFGLLTNTADGAATGEIDALQQVSNTVADEVSAVGGGDLTTTPTLLDPGSLDLSVNVGTILNDLAPSGICHPAVQPGQSFKLSDAAPQRHAHPADHPRPTPRRRRPQRHARPTDHPRPTPRECHPWRHCHPPDQPRRPPHRRRRLQRRYHHSDHPRPSPRRCPRQRRQPLRIVERGKHPRRHRPQRHQHQRKLPDRWHRAHQRPPQHHRVGSSGFNSSSAINVSIPDSTVLSDPRGRLLGSSGNQDITLSPSATSSRSRFGTAGRLRTSACPPAPSSRFLGTSGSQDITLSTTLEVAFLGTSGSQDITLSTAKPLESLLGTAAQRGRQHPAQHPRRAFPQHAEPGPGHP